MPRWSNPSRRWTPKEKAYIRRRYLRADHRQIASALGRTLFSVKSYCKAHGLVSRRFWNEVEKRVVRELYRKVPATRIAEKLNRTPGQVHQCARMMGLSIPQKFKAPDMVAFIRARNAEGWSDSEIARARGVDRHAVTHVRKSLGLPWNRFSEHVRDNVRKKTAEQLARMGLTAAGLAGLRYAAHRKFARQSGWPEDLRLRAVQILNVLWERGPMTRREIADAIGMPWKGSRKSLVSNDPEGSYLAHLIGRGLVVVSKRAFKVQGRGKGRSCSVYSLPVWIERKVAS